jgi:hypothetical protein
MNRSIVLASVAAASILAIVWSTFWRPSEPAQRARTVASLPAVERNAPTSEPEPSAHPVETASLVASATPVSTPPDERSLMNDLRELGDSAPERSLELARDGNRRFPDSADAPERTWYVCKSLVNLEKFYDAREAARLMVARYPGTTWAMDVARHLLVNPLDLPGDPQP